MKRGSFLRSLFAIAVSPKIITEIAAAPPIATINSGCIVGGGSLIADLNLLTPRFYQSYIDKYGSEEYGLFIAAVHRDIEEELDNDGKFYWFEKRKSICQK